MPSTGEPGPVDYQELADAVDPAVIGRLRLASAALVLDQVEGCVWLSSPMRPLGTGDAHTRLCGPALTVNAPPGDNVALRVALDAVTEGQVLVIAGRAFMGRALVGEILVRQAIARGAAGFVIEGAVRDAARLAEMDVPVFCLGSALLRATKYGYGDVGFPVAIANEVVYPGDVVVGDGEGLVVVRKASADVVSRKVIDALEYESARLQVAATGALDLGTAGVVRPSSPLR